MSKLSNMLLMVFKLQTGGIYSIEYLSNMLEVSPRQVRRYRDDLELSGIYIHSKTGKQGGYYLDEDSIMHNVSSLVGDYDELLSSLFQYEDGLSINDIAKLYQIFNEESYLKECHNVQEIKNYMIITYLTRERRVTTIEYLTKTGNMLSYNVHPYFTFKKYGMLYLAAFEQQRKKIIYLRIERINRVFGTRDTYIVDEDLKKHELSIVTINQGVFYRSKLFNVQLECNKRDLSFIEDLFNNDIEPTLKDDEHLTLNIKVGKVEEIKHILLSLGSKIKVLEPKSLRETLKNEYRNALRIYEN